MPARPPGAGMRTNSGNVPAIPDTSGLRVVSTTSDAAGEPPPITRTSMSAIENHARSRRNRVMVAVVVGVVVLVIGAAVAAALFTGDEANALALASTL
ncbi:MAG TPA: hypothetical protein H9769_13005 [Candidatus Microbacterium pullistercoris]|nr:hypothetical protein [Candidatus Microbacterium pullistercoris]